MSTHRNVFPALPPFDERPDRAVMAQAARVNEPLMFAHVVDGVASLLVTFAGKARQGLNFEFSELVKELDPTINIADTATFTTSLYSGSFFVLRYADTDETATFTDAAGMIAAAAAKTAKLRAFADRLQFTFQERTKNLPKRAVTRLLRMTVVTRHDRPTQLNAICTVLANPRQSIEALQQDIERKRTGVGGAPVSFTPVDLEAALASLPNPCPEINITALLGRREPEPGRNGTPAVRAKLDFVLGLPDNAEGFEAFLKPILELVGTTRGEQWAVEVMTCPDDGDLLQIFAGVPFSSFGGDTVEAATHDRQRPCANIVF